MYLPGSTNRGYWRGGLFCDTLVFGSGDMESHHIENDWVQNVSAEGLIDYLQYSTKGAFNSEGEQEEFEGHPAAGCKVTFAPADKGYNWVKDHLSPTHVSQSWMV